MINRSRFDAIRRTVLAATAALLASSLFVGAAVVPGYTTYTPLTSLTVAAAPAAAPSLSA